MTKEKSNCTPLAMNHEHLCNFSYTLLLKGNPQASSKKQLSRLIELTSRSVGLPLKKSVFLLLFGGLNLKFRKAHPLAIASKGAGPSYGNPRPTNSWKIQNKRYLNFCYSQKSWELAWKKQKPILNVPAWRKCNAKKKMGEIQQLTTSHPSSNGMSCKTHLTIIICNELSWFFMELRQQQTLLGQGKNRWFDWCWSGAAGAFLQVQVLRQQSPGTAAAMFSRLPKQPSRWLCQQEHAPGTLIKPPN